MFLGLMKYYRRATSTSSGAGSRGAESYRRIVTRFFDRVEVAFCSSGATSGEAGRELSAVNRTM